MTQICLRLVTHNRIHTNTHMYSQIDLNLQILV